MKIDEYELTTEKGEILLTDEELPAGKVVGLGVFDHRSIDESWAYIDLTVAETANLIDELNRRLDVARSAARKAGR